MDSKFPSTITKIQIYNGSFGTRELDSAMLAILRSVHKKPWKIEITYKLELERDDILYIIICPAGLGLNDVVMPKYYINWQLEFLIGRYNHPVYLNRLRQALDNWDYSKMNITISSTRDKINYHHVPPGFIETITTPDILSGQYVYTDEGKDIDVLFLGYCEAYPRRIKIRSQFQETGLNIYFPSALDIHGMQQAIRRSKVCINMAAFDYFILAQVRMNILFSNQACVVSEKSADEDDDVLYGEGGMLVVDYDNIVEQATSLVKDFELRRKTALKSYQWYKQNRRWSDIVDWAELLP